VNAFAGFRAARLLLAEAERELWDSPQVRRPVDADAIIDAVAGLLRPLTAVMLCLSTDRVTPNPTRRAKCDALTYVINDVLTDLEKLRTRAPPRGL